jgi:diacylglycerol kinase
MDVAFARLYAYKWFNENIQGINSNVKISKKSEVAIQELNNTLTTLTSNSRWYIELLRDHFWLISGIIMLTSFLSVPSTTIYVFVFCWMMGRQVEALNFLSAIDYCIDDAYVKVDKNKCDYFPKFKREMTCRPKVRAYPMIYMDDHIPAFPRVCYHNVYCAITRRMLNVVKVHNDHKPIILPPTLLEICKRINGNLLPLEFGEWLSRFPSSKQKAYQREMHRFSKMCSSRGLNDTKVFIKFEAMKNDSKPARCISATDVWTNFMVGRWIIPLTHLFALECGKDSEVFLPFESSAEDVAEFLCSMFDPKALNRVSQNNFATTHNPVVQNDFSSYDSTQTSVLVEAVLEVYRMCGVDEDVLNLLYADLDEVMVTTAVGIKFHAGGFRFSGRGDTLLSNSLLAWIIQYTVYGDRLVKLLAKGDDSVALLDCESTFLLNKNEFTKLGLQDKSSLCSKHDVEFCSKLLVPVDGGYTMGPKIGRYLVKTFWCKKTNYTFNQMVEQLQGIVTGCWKDICFAPILKELRPFLIKGSGVYSEYSLRNIKFHKMNGDTLEYYAKRYSVHIHELNQFELPSYDIPINMCNSVTSQICDVDWGEEGNTQLLKRKRKIQLKEQVFIPVLEELVKFLLGWMAVLIIGGFESIVYKTPYNVVMHVLLFKMPLPLSIILHVLHNLTIHNKLSVGPSVKHLYNMAKKGKGNQKKKQNKVKAKKNSTFDDINSALGPLVRKAVANGLRAGGSMAGNFVAPGIGGEYGRKIGGGISKILGFGDYVIKSNTLTQAPQFGKRNSSFRVKNREYVGDIISSTTFGSTTYNINPGNNILFPWLSTVAAGYQQYKVNGMMFFYNSTSANAIGSTNTALGTVIMATNYDVSEDSYSSKQAMLASYFSDSGPPSEDMAHAIECDPSSRPIDTLYVDHGGESANDPALFNLGNFQVATAGAQASSNVGELWVSYDITFYKPCRGIPKIGTLIANGPWTSTEVLCAIQTKPQGLPVKVSAAGGGYDTIDLSNYGGEVVQVTIIWYGTSLSGWTPSVSFESGLTVVNVFQSDYAHYTTATTALYTLTYCWRVKDTAYAKATYTMSGGTGTPTNVDVEITGFNL